MTDGRRFSKPISKPTFLARFGVHGLAAALAILVFGLLFYPYLSEAPRSPEGKLVATLTPAQMQRAMILLHEEHDAVNEFARRRELASEEREARRAKERELERELARDMARDMARAEEERAADEPLTSERMKIAGANRVAADQARANNSARAPRKSDSANVAAKSASAPAVSEAAPSSPLPITPAVTPQRGPVAQALAAMGEWKDKTLAAADTVRDFFTSAAERAIGGISGSAPTRLMSVAW